MAAIETYDELLVRYEALGYKKPEKELDTVTGLRFYYSLAKLAHLKQEKLVELAIENGIATPDDRGQLLKLLEDAEVELPVVDVIDSSSLLIPFLKATPPKKKATPVKQKAYSVIRRPLSPFSESQNNYLGTSLRAPNRLMPSTSVRVSKLPKRRATFEDTSNIISIQGATDIYAIVPLKNTSTSKANAMKIVRQLELGSRELRDIDDDLFPIEFYVELINEYLPVGTSFVAVPAVAPAATLVNPARSMLRRITTPRR